jgi:uncharacterized protein
MPSRRSRARRISLLIAGWAFIVLGVLGLFLPFLQGVLFLMIGLYLLSLQWPRARLMRQRLRARHPALARKSDEARDWALRQWARLRRTVGRSRLSARRGPR